MKNLKIKFGLFSLLAVLAVSVFLTSCEPKELTEVTLGEDSITLLDIGQSYVLPHGVVYNEENVAVYLAEADNSTKEKLNNNFKVAKFLVEQNLHTKISSSLTYGDNISDVNFDTYLDTNQLIALDTYLNSTTNEVESRCWRCSKTQYNGGWCTYTCTKSGGCQICPCDSFSYISPC